MRVVVDWWWKILVARDILANVSFLALSWLALTIVLLLQQTVQANWFGNQNLISFSNPGL